MPPGEQPLRPLWAQKLPADKKSQDLPSEDLDEPAVVEGAHLLEQARLVHSSLRHEEMQMRVKIDAVSECLDDRDNTGLKCFPRRGLKIKEKRSNGTAAELSLTLPLTSPSDR